jgi:hypothetical protein
MERFETGKSILKEKEDKDTSSGLDEVVLKEKGV